MKILQQQVSSWLAKDISGKQGTCRNHLMYLHTLVFKQKHTRLLGWGSYERLCPCEESHQNKILAWQFEQECCPYSLLQQAMCLLFQVTHRCPEGRSHCVKKLGGVCLHWFAWLSSSVITTGSQSKEWMLFHGLMVFTPNSLQWCTIKSASHEVIRAGTTMCTRTVTVRTS